MPIQTGPDYITHCRTLGFSDVEIAEAMKKGGWQNSDIQAAFLAATHKTTPTQTPGTTPKKSKLILWIIIGVVACILLAAGGSALYFVLQS